jgi:demethylmenaquinone methyltransferase/2-methoxy-6-polyprenyl-1,4-benzoquinol methylase
LPFDNETFDAVVSGFLLRNVNDIRVCLSEQYRTLKPGGHIVALDTTRPSQTWYKPLIYFHLNMVIPILGKWVAGDQQAYTYLPESTQGFLSAEELEDTMKSSGFREVGFRRTMLGTIAIHWGIK